MEENNNIDSIIGNDEYVKSVEEINKVILDKLMETVGVSKEYERGFDYAWMSKQPWWNDMSSQRYIERLEDVMKMISEQSKKMSLKFVGPFLINKNLCYAMKKFGSIRKFKKAAKKQHPIFGHTVYNPVQYIPMFKVLSKAKNDKERHQAKNGIKKIFKYDFFDENQFATIKEPDLKFDFSDNMNTIHDYDDIGFDYETEDLGFPCS